MTTHLTRCGIMPIAKPPVWVVLLVLLVCVASACKADDICEANPTQVAVMQHAYSVGSADDLGETLAAIAWEESRAGKFRMNVQSQDYGVVAVSLKTARSLEGVEKGTFSENILAQRLTMDDDYSLRMGLGILKYYQNYWGNWKLAVRSYNAGFKHTDAVKYQQRVHAYIKRIRQCDWSLNEHFDIRLGDREPHKVQA